MNLKSRGGARSSASMERDSSDQNILLINHYLMEKMVLNKKKKKKKFNIALNIHHGLCVAPGGEDHWRLCDGEG